MSRARLPLHAAAPLCLAGTVLFAAGPGVPGTDGTGETVRVAGTEAASATQTSRPGATGVIEGRVISRERPRRRIADRYATAGGSGRERPPVPPVVHLAGGAAAGRDARAETLRMTQRDTAFAPPVLVARVGASVEFPNEDPFFHNVFSYSRVRRFDLGRFPQGESKSVRFERPGYVKIFCEVHPWMRGGVLVVDTPHSAVVAADGTFRLEGVPAGRHIVVVTDFDRGEQRAEVEVRSGVATPVEIEL